MSGIWMHVWLATGAMAAIPLIASSPADGKAIPPQPCETVSPPLPVTSTCIIYDGVVEYEISLVVDSYVKAFPNPSTADMFWWRTGKARDAAAAVGGAFGFPNFSSYGPYFAEFETSPSSGGELLGGVCILGGNGSIGCYGGIPLARCWEDTFMCGDPPPAPVSVWARSSRIFDEPSVPGPIPALGAAAALRFSRSLRRRIKRSARASACPFSL